MWYMRYFFRQVYFTTWTGKRPLYQTLANCSPSAQSDLPLFLYNPKAKDIFLYFQMVEGRNSEVFHDTWNSDFSVHKWNTATRVGLWYGQKGTVCPRWVKSITVHCLQGAFQSLSRLWGRSGPLPMSWALFPPTECLPRRTCLEALLLGLPAAITEQVCGPKKPLFSFLSPATQGSSFPELICARHSARSRGF